MAEQLTLTPAEAEALLPEHAERIHNITSGGMMIGCDYDRADAVAAFAAAKQIVLAGEMAHALRHPLAVIEQSGRTTFFEADMAKVEAFEAERSAA